MAKKKILQALTAHQMAKRVCEREDNIYDRRIIENILDMYMDECRKAFMSGERVSITKVGSIIPEVKVHEGYFNLPVCNKEDGNPPYTNLKFRRNNYFAVAMNSLLVRNIKNGIYGLDKLPFSRPQMDILKKSGYIPEDAEIEEMGDGEE